MTWAVHISLAPTWFDPAETPGIGTPFMILYALHDALVKPMPGNAVAPSLAESWAGRRTVSSTSSCCARARKFHNGEPVTAEDVKFSFERYRGAASKLLQEIVAAVVEVVDALRVRFKLKEPWPDFMTYYGSLATGAGWVVPKKYLEKVGDDGFKKAPIGAGPYRFVSFNPGIELVLEAHEQYWRKSPEREAAGDQGRAGRGHAPGDAQARRGRRRLLAPGRARRGSQADTGAHPQADAHRVDALARIPRPVGSRSRPGPTGGCAWRRTTR